MSLTENPNEPISVEDDDDIEIKTPGNNFNELDQNILISLAREENEYMDERRASACYRMFAYLFRFCLYLVPLIEPMSIGLFSVLQFYYLARQGTDIQADIDKIFFFCLFMGLYSFIMHEADEYTNTIELDKRYFSRVIMVKRRKGVLVPLLRLFISLILLFVVIGSFKSTMFEYWWAKVYSTNP